MTVDALPGRKEPGERPLVRRLDLLAQHRERRPPQSPQHLRMTPLTFAAAGPQLTPHDFTGALELAQRGARVDAVAGANLARGERAVSLPVARDELYERVRNVLQERRGQPTRRGDAERIAIQARVGGVDEP